MSTFVRSRPDPSVITIPSVGRPHGASVSSTAADPAALVPAPEATRPISLSSDSAVLSSLVVSISRTTSSTGTEVDAGNHRGGGITHSPPGPPTTSMPALQQDLQLLRRRFGRVLSRQVVAGVGATVVHQQRTDGPASRLAMSPAHVGT